MPHTKDQLMSACAARRMNLFAWMTAQSKHQHLLTSTANNNAHISTAKLAMNHPISKEKQMVFNKFPKDCSGAKRETSEQSRCSPTAKIHGGRESFVPFSAWGFLSIPTFTCLVKYSNRRNIHPWRQSSATMSFTHVLLTSPFR